MFEALTDRLHDVFSAMGRKDTLTEKDVDAALREVKLAMLEADVNFKVVRDFTNRLKVRAVGVDIMQSLSPVQQVVKLVNEELVGMLGETSPLDIAGASVEQPVLIMMVGLQGAGKTTTTAKLANLMRKQGHAPLMVAADIYRPAAIDQLVTLGRQLGLPVYEESPTSQPLEICQHGVAAARAQNCDVVLFDTAGRLHVDDAMMDEVATIRMRLGIPNVLLVVDAMTGQDAVNAAEEFNARVPVSGLILTKMDGDARGGAALSIRSVTGIPVKFIATGEKSDALEPFYPDRLASRILGMGDILSLIEKAEQTMSEEQAKSMEHKLRTATFTLEDFRDQLQQIKKMGPLTQLLEMIPGMRAMTKDSGIGQIDESHLQRIEAIIGSMTQRERRQPEVIDGSRRRRIAAGSGTTVAELNQLLKQFEQMRRMMKQLTSGRMRGLMRGLPGL